jgi:MFS family permease
LLSSSDEQGKNLGVAQSLSAIARIAGPVCGGWLYQSVSMVVPFWASCVSALVGVGLLLTIYAGVSARRPA